MKQAIRMLIAMVVLGVGMVVVWKFKWVLLGGALVYTLILMACNHYYRKATGKDMTIYTRIMKD